MGQDENKNPFSGNVTPNPRATFTSGNRLGMRPSRNLSAAEELDRISADSAPVQPQAQANSDIVLNNGKAPKNGSTKRFVIIIGIILVFAALIGVATFVMTQQQNNSRNTTVANNFSDEELTKIFEQYGENSAEIDIFFRKINDKKLSGSEIFTKETSDELKVQLSSIQSLQTEINKKGSENELIKDDLSKLKQKLSTNLEIYSKATEIYSDFYSATTNFNVSLIQKYLTSEPQKSATEKYLVYINNSTNITNLQTQIDTACPKTNDNTTVISQVCNNLLNEYLTLTAVLDDSEILTNIFISTTEKLSEGNEPVSKNITNIMNGLGI